jgi:hypothetical protein
MYFDASTGKYRDVDGAELPDGDPRVVAARAAQTHTAPPTQPPAFAATAPAVAAYKPPPPVAPIPPAQPPQQPTAPPAPSGPAETEVSGIRISKAERAARAGLQPIRADQQDNVRAAGDVAGQEADITRNAAIDRQAAASAAEAETNAVVEAANKELQAKVAKRTAAYEEHKKAQLNDYWADKSTGNKIASAIFIGLGAAGAALTGGRNTAHEIINNAIERDFRLQKERIEKLKDQAAFADKDVEGARQAKIDAVADLTIRKAAAKESAAATYEAKLTALGRSKAEIATNADVLKIRESAQRDLIEVAELDRKTVKQKFVNPGAGSGKPPSEGQANRQVLFDSGLDALNTIVNGPGLSKEGAKIVYQDPINEKALEGAPVTRAVGNAVAGFLGAKFEKTVGEKLTKDSDRQYVQAIGRINDLINKEISGAASSDPEYKRRLELNIIRPGDSIADQRRKAQGALSIIESMGAQGADPRRNAAAVQAIRSGTYAPASPAAGGGGMSQEQINAAKMWLVGNPNDPRASGVRAKLKEMGAL